MMNHIRRSWSLYNGSWIWRHWSAVRCHVWPWAAYRCTDRSRTSYGCGLWRLWHQRRCRLNRCRRACSWSRRSLLSHNRWTWSRRTLGRRGSILFLLLLTFWLFWLLCLSCCLLSCLLFFPPFCSSILKPNLQDHNAWWQTWNETMVPSRYA